MTEIAVFTFFTASNKNNFNFIEPHRRAPLAGLQEVVLTGCFASIIVGLVINVCLVVMTVVLRITICKESVTHSGTLAMHST